MSFRRKTVPWVVVLAGAMVSGLWGCFSLCISDFSSLPLNAEGYVIEELPVTITSSFARGNDVYLGTQQGQIFKVDDSDLNKPWTALSCPFDVSPRLLFVSRAGTLFTSAPSTATYRSDDGQTWQSCLDLPVWRMDEDDQGNLYAGNYTKDDQHVATLYASADEGATWRTIFRDEHTDHIHTVRWDDQAKRLYIAFGDGKWRGQACSDDRGTTWTILDRGPRQGHTDVGFTNDYIIWASDDQSGRLFRVARPDSAPETIPGCSQFMWFVVAGGHQIYVGTITSLQAGGERAALLASSDQGDTWQKLLETDVSTGAYDQGFLAESRVLSAGGWLYCSEGKWLSHTANKSFRIRRDPKCLVDGCTH